MNKKPFYAITALVVLLLNANFIALAGAFKEDFLLMMAGVLVSMLLAAIIMTIIFDRLSRDWSKK